MGSDKKSRKRRSPSSSPSPSDYSSSEEEEGEEEDRKSKKHRTTTTTTRADKKKDKKDKKSSSHRHSDKGKKSEEKHAHKRHKRSSHLAIPELSKDDYFAKNNEFATWLKQDRKIFFSDLSSEEARKLFSSFVKAWNKGKLESQYYEGIATAPRTSHNWKIRG